MKVAIVSSPNMINPKDWEKLSLNVDVEYFEREQLTTENLLELIKDKDYLILNREALQTLELPSEFYSKVKVRNYPLKAISLDYTGIDWANPTFAKNNGIILMNTPYYSALSVAEYALSLILLHAKKINEIYKNFQRNGKSSPHKNTVITNKTLGIVGLGHIGQQLSKLANALGMKVIAWNRTQKQIDGVENVSLEKLFSDSDFISIHLQTSDETKKIISDKLLSQVKQGVIVINLADRKLINNDILLEYIRRGQIAGYAIESEEQINHPIAQEKSVTIFPPQAWFTDDSLQKLTKTWVNNIVTAIEGHPENVVS